MNSVILKFCPQCNSQATNQDDKYCEYCGSFYKTVPIRQKNDFSTNLKNQKNFIYYLYNGFLLNLLILLIPFDLNTVIIEGLLIAFLSLFLVGNVYIHSFFIRSDKTRPLAIIFNGLLVIFFVIAINLPSFGSLYNPNYFFDELVQIIIIPVLFLTGNVFLMNSHNKNIILQQTY